MRRLLLSFLAAGLLAPALLRGADGSSWDAWRKGYDSFSKGERLRDRGEYVQAMGAFREALDFYNQVKKARPDWNQNIIGARLADCEREISSLRRLTGSEADSPPVTASTAPAVGGADFVTLEAMRRELEQYKQKLLDAMVELEDARRQIAQNKAGATELANLLRDQRVMQEKYALLEKRYQSLEQQALAPDKRTEELNQRLVEEKLNSEVLARRLEVAEERIRKSEQDLIGANRDKNVAELAAKRSSADLVRLERELEELRRFKADSMARAGELDLAGQTRELKLKSALEKLELQERELLAVRALLENAAKSGPGAVSGNFVEENRKLRESVAALEKAAAERDEENAALQNRQRTVQLEIVQIRETLQRVDALRLRLEKENALAAKDLERERSSAELTAVELKNLRARNERLESDMKVWSERCAKLEARLENRDSEAYKNLTESDAARRKLTDQISAMALELKERKRELEELSNAKDASEKAAEESRKELLAAKSNKLAMEEKLNAASGDVAKLAKLQPELAELKKNFQALKAENEERGKALEVLAILRREFAAAQTRLKELEAFPSRLAEREKENQKLAEAKAKLENELKARPVITATAAEPAPPRVTPPDGVDVPALLAAGRKAENEEAWDLAVWNYRSAMARDPENAEAALRLGNLYLRQEEFVQAEPLLAKAMERHGDLPALAAGRAAALIGQRKFGNAIAVLEKPLAARPQDFLLQMAMARALAGSGQRDMAETHFRAAAKLKPDSPEPPLELARLLAAGDEKAAAGFYREALERGAKPDPVLEPVLGKLLNEKRELVAFMTSAAAEAAKGGDWTSALWYYRQLAEIDRENREFPLRIALGSYELGDYPRALETLEMNPASPVSELLRIMIAVKQGKFSDAQTRAENILRSSGGKPLALPEGWAFLHEELQSLLTAPDMKGSVAAIECAKMLGKL